MPLSLSLSSNNAHSSELSNVMHGHTCTPDTVEDLTDCEINGNKQRERVCSAIVSRTAANFVI